MNSSAVDSSIDLTVVFILRLSGPRSLPSLRGRRGDNPPSLSRSADDRRLRIPKPASIHRKCTRTWPENRTAIRCAERRRTCPKALTLPSPQEPRPNSQHPPPPISQTEFRE